MKQHNHESKWVLIMDAILIVVACLLAIGVAYIVITKLKTKFE